MAIDGVYVRDEEGELQFYPLPKPTAEDVMQVAMWTHERLLKVLEDRRITSLVVCGEGGKVEGVLHVQGHNAVQPQRPVVGALGVRLDNRNRGVRRGHHGFVPQRNLARSFRGPNVMETV